MIFDTARVAPEKAVFRPALPPSSMPVLNGTDMPKLSYSEQLQHPNWQRKRLETLSHYGFACANCGDKERMLHVHHRRYIKGRMAWEYAVSELNVLCKDCHASEHADRDLMEEVLAAAEAEGYGPEFIAGLVGGYMDCSLVLDEDLDGRVMAATGPYFIEGQVAAIINSLPFNTLGRILRENVKTINPAEEAAIKFLESFKPAKDLPEL